MKRYRFCLFLLVFNINLLAQQPRLVLPIGHTKYVKCAQFSLDGKKIVTASGDNTIKIWDSFKGVLLANLTGHSSFVNSVQFSPDGKKIVSSSSDNTVKIWSEHTGVLLADLKGHKGGVNSAQFSPDGKKIVSSSSDKTAIVWNATNGKLLVELKGHHNGVNSAQFSPDGAKVITSSDDKTARIWNVTTGLTITILKGNTAVVQSAEFSPDGKKIITVSDDTTARIWNAQNGILLAELKKHDSYIYSAQFSPDGNRIVTASQDGTAKIWDAATATIIADLPANALALNSPYSEVVSSKLSVQYAAFSPDGMKIVTVAGDNTVNVWDGMNGNWLLNLVGHERAVLHAVFSMDGKRIATSSEDYTSKIWEVNTGRMVADLKGHSTSISNAIYSRKGNKILTTSWDNAAKVWNVEYGTLLLDLKGHDAAITSGEFSPDSKKIVTTSLDKTGKIWDAVSGTLLAHLKGHIDGVYTGHFNLDGTKLLTSSSDNAAIIWDVATGMKILEMVHWSPLTSAEFSPDEKYIFATSIDGLMIWDAVTGKEVDLKINWESPFVTYTPDRKKIIMSPNRKYILTISEGKNMINKTAGKGEKLFEITVPNIMLSPTQFSPDSKKILTVSSDNTSQVWDARSGKLNYTFFSVDQTDYFAQIPSGFYQSTTGASKLLHYVTRDLKVISFEQLDVKYNRPDKVLEAIGNTDTALIKSYRKAWEKRIKKLGIDTTAFRDGYSVPEADFTNRDAIEYEQKSGTLKLIIKANDSTYKLDRFNVWVNETPLFGQRGISIRKRNKNDFDTTITVKLSQGENRIETSITNVNGTESYRMPLTVSYSPVIKQKESIRFIGIGIDQFADSKYNLQYSAKDIRDLSKKLKEKYKDDIVIDTLFNENVTTSNVKALKLNLLQTTENDKVIVAYSGHGMLSKEYDYYLSTYSVNFDKPEQNGLPYDELENLLDSIPARKKLMLIDACHSGEVDKEDLITLNTSSDSLIKGLKPVAYKQEGHLGLKNSFELMQSLFVNVGKSTGATIISAAAGTQFALERNDLKNGVFTYSILEAMKTNATMKISELKTIVGKRVEELTKSLQKPTSRNETIAVDWNVW